MQLQHHRQKGSRRRESRGGKQEGKQEGKHEGKQENEHEKGSRRAVGGKAGKKAEIVVEVTEVRRIGVGRMTRIGAPERSVRRRGGKTQLGKPRQRLRNNWKNC